MVKKIFVFLLGLMLALGTFFNAFAGGVSTKSTYIDMFAGESKIYMLNSEGEIYVLNEKNEPLEEPVAIVDMEKEFVYVSGDSLFALQKDTETVKQIYPKNPGIELYKIDIKNSVAKGGDSWYLSRLTMHQRNLYFMFEDFGEKRFCRYSVKDKNISYLEIPDLSSFFVSNDDTVKAVCTNEDKTVLYSVDWDDGSFEEYLTLKGKWTGFCADGEYIYASNQNAFVRFKDKKEDKRAESPYSKNIIAAAIVNGKYTVASSFDVYGQDFDAGLADKKTITVLGCAFDAIDLQFMKENPDIEIKSLGYDSYEGLDFATALLTGSIRYDVAKISNSTYSANALMEKGYCMDMSFSEELNALAQKLYDPFKKFSFRGNKLLLIPYNAFVKDLYAINFQNLEEAGLTPEDLPKTLEEYFDFTIKWYSEHDKEDAELVPLLYEGSTTDNETDNTYMAILSSVMQTYSTHYRRTGQTLSFDTPEFRELLNKVREVKKLVAVSSETYFPKAMFYYIDYYIPDVSSFSLPLSENENYKYSGEISGYIIDPRTEQAEAAAKYIAYRIKNLPDIMKILLFDGEYKAIERESYGELLASLEDKKTLIEEALENSDNEFEKRDLQQKLEQINEKINNPSDSDKFAITDEQIAFYQKEIIPNLEIAFSDMTNEYSYDNKETWNILKRYVAGGLDDEGFISVIERRQKLKRLEEQ